MRSSDVGPRLARLAGLVVASVLTAACSRAPLASQSPTTSSSSDCVAADAGLSAEDAEMVASLRRTVEMGPLYAVSVAKAGVSACRSSHQSGTITLEYTLRDGGWLRVTRQPDIEYTDQEVRFASPLTEDPVSVLTRAEEAAFGAGRCGIDWRDGERRPAGDAPSATDIIYRGDVCNCQARVRSDAAGRVMGLVFRSAC